MEVTYRLLDEQREIANFSVADSVVTVRYPKDTALIVRNNFVGPRGRIDFVPE